MSVLVLIGIGLLALFVLQPCVFRQTFFPPIVDKGYHASSLWIEARARWWADHWGARCCVSFRRESRTRVILGIEQGRWFGWRIVVNKVKVKKLRLHEAIYPPNGARRSRVPHFWLFPMTEEVHQKMHKFDRWLWPTLTLGLWHDRRNRLLWLSTLLFVYGRYALVLIPFAIWRVMH